MAQPAVPAGQVSPLMGAVASKLIEALGETAGPLGQRLSASSRSNHFGFDLVDVLKTLRAQTSDELLGLGAARCPLGTYKLMIELSVRCADLRDALIMGFRFLALSTSALEFELIECDDEAIIEIREPESERDSLGILADWSLIVWSKYPQWLIGGPISFKRVELAHSPYVEESVFSETFSAPCVFDRAQSRLVFRRAYLDRKIVKNLHDAEKLNANPIGFATPRIGIADSLTEQVREIWLAEQENGQARSSIDLLARQFGVSGQTLRRRLSAEGVSYRDLKARTGRRRSAGGSAPSA